MSKDCTQYGTTRSNQFRRWRSTIVMDQSLFHKHANLSLLLPFLFPYVSVWQWLWKCQQPPEREASCGFLFDKLPNCGDMFHPPHKTTAHTHTWYLMLLEHKTTAASFRRTVHPFSAPQSICCLIDLPCVFHGRHLQWPPDQAGLISATDSLLCFAWWLQMQQLWGKRGINNW